MSSLTEQNNLSGVGIGLRTPHLSYLLDPDNCASQDVPWLEILADNYLQVGGIFAAQLASLANRYPLSFHCVGMSIGSAGGINRPYLHALKKLADRHQPVWISDHLSWSNLDQQRSHDLLPLAYTDANLRYLIQQVKDTQELLERPILLENISAYITHPENKLTEAEFLSELCHEAGCFILLDINNLYVNQQNLNLDIQAYLKKLPLEKIKQLHLGGHEARGDLLVDTHGAAVCQAVWQLYEQVIMQAGPVPTLIEWDNNVPDFEVLIQQREMADAIMRAKLAQTNETNKPNTQPDFALADNARHGSPQTRQARMT